MKIAFYTPNWPLGIKPNGIVTYYGNIIPELCKFGHEIYLIVGWILDNQYDSSELFVVEVKHTIGRLDNLVTKMVDLISPGYGHYRTGASAIIGAMRHVQDVADIDVFEMEDTFGWNALVANSVDLPVVVRLHGPHFLVGRHDSKKIFSRSYSNRIRREGRAFQKARYISAPSQNVINETQSYYGIEWPLTKIIPNAVSLTPPEHRWSLAHCNRQEILFVGRFDHLKGGDLIIDAFSQLAKQHPNVRLSFVGPDYGIMGADGRNSGIHEYIETNVPNSIGDRISYLGLLAPAEIEPLRRKAYVTVVCSRYENFPNVVLEALAFGCPLIATAVGGIPEIIRDGYNGLLVNPNDTNALAERLDELMNNDLLARKLSSQAVIDCADRFNPHKIARESEDFYKLVCDSHSF